MSLNPEAFRGLSPAQMLTVLAVEEAVARGVEAKASGAACVSCRDTGMSAGRFCGCQAGSKLAVQGFGG